MKRVLLAVEDGFTEEIRAAVLPEDLFQRVANTSQDQLPVDGFGDGATYSRNGGELWFRSADQWCVIHASTYDADGREQIARQLASSLNERR